MAQKMPFLRILSKALRSVKIFEVRCIFGKIESQNQKFRSENSGIFPFRTSLSTGVPFRKPKKVPKIFAKLTKTPVYFRQIFDRRNSGKVNFCERQKDENFRPTQCLNSQTKFYPNTSNKPMKDCEYRIFVCLPGQRISKTTENKKANNEGQLYFRTLILP